MSKSIVTYPTVAPYLMYEDATAALSWLCKAFGFRERLRYAEPDGRISHAELTLGDGVVMIGSPGEGYQSPATHGHRGTMIAVTVPDVDAHCDRARAAGATIVSEPKDQPYGERSYRARDLEGQDWSFGQHVRDVAPEDWGAVRA
jgi:uncharacterized glyoxalase superfamily protein PhnB